MEQTQFLEPSRCNAMASRQDPHVSIARDKNGLVKLGGETYERIGGGFGDATGAEENDLMSRRF
jgi:hypothetical protein